MKFEENELILMDLNYDKEYANLVMIGSNEKVSGFKSRNEESLEALSFECVLIDLNSSRLNISKADQEVVHDFIINNDEKESKAIYVLTLAVRNADYILAKLAVLRIIGLAKLL